MMRHGLTVAAALMCGQSALAQESGDASLRAALTVLPAEVFAPTHSDLTSFLDLSLLAELHSGRLDRPAFQRGQAVSGLRPVDALAMAGPEEWSMAAGTDIANLRFVAGYGQPPNQVAIWGFSDEAAASDAFAGLTERGFSPFGTLPGVVANGEPGQMDMSARNPADPWRGMLGKSSFVTQRGAIFLHADLPDAFAPILGAASSAEASPTGAALLAGLEAQEGVTVQAMLFGPSLGLHSGIDPSVLMTATPDKAIAAIEEAMTAPVPGVPLYSGAILADLQGAGGPVMVLALAYSDCATAEAAAAQAAALWSESAPDIGAAVPSHVDAGASGCAAVISVAGDGEVNAPFDRAVRGIFQRDLLPIRVSME
ncbi:MAG: hypothetical protein J0L76_10340 [Rhodobacterales bacterium]|nr:hypothetical protein [Rhodobacterales bacterium]